LLTPLRCALFCPSTLCRFLTNAEQVHSGSIHPKGATHFWWGRIVCNSSGTSPEEMGEACRL